MKKLTVAMMFAFLLPAAQAQEGKKGMEMKGMEKKQHMKKEHMEKKHGAMHDKMEKKAKGKHEAKKGAPSKKDEHKH